MYTFNVPIPHLPPSSSNPSHLPHPNPLWNYGHLIGNTSVQNPTTAAIQNYGHIDLTGGAHQRYAQCGRTASRSTRAGLESFKYGGCLSRGESAGAVAVAAATARTAGRVASLHSFDSTSVRSARPTRSSALCEVRSCCHRSTHRVSSHVLEMKTEYVLL